MANLLKTSEERHAEILQSHAGTTGTYSRGKTELAITLTRGRAGRQQDFQTGEVSWFDQDWLIPASLLASLGEPERGDKITVDGDVFKVLPPDENEPCWRWAGNHRTIYRVHSERIKQA